MLSAYPLDQLQCVTCDHVGLSATSDRVFCPQCGQVLPVVDGILDCLATVRPSPLTPAQSVAQSPVFAWGYERLWRPWALSILSGEAFPPHREAQVLQELVGDAELVLDLATGCGYWSRMLLAQDAQRWLVGLDQSLAVLQEAQRQRQPHWRRYSLVRATVERIPLAPQSVSAVISGASLNELPLVATLQEVSRVLKPGGVFVTMHSRQGEGWAETVQQVLGTMGLQFYSEMDLRQHGDPVHLKLQRYLTYGAVAFAQMVKVA